MSSDLKNRLCERECHDTQLEQPRDDDRTEQVRGDLAGDANAAIFGAQPGYITPPIKIDKGWYLFKVEALLRATLDDATRATIKAKLLKEWLDERRRKAHIAMPLFELLREEDEL